MFICANTKKACRAALGLEANFVDGTAYSSPTEAATAIAGKRTNGWWLFVTDPLTKRSLRNIRRDYIDTRSVDADDDDQDDEEDEDDT
jgi:hypothetical protein